MKKWRSQALIAGLILFVQSVLAQNVKLANIAFGMSETEVKTALASNAPFYVNQASDYSEMHYLVAETKAESYAFTMISNKVVGFSVMHILPPGQLPFLPPGQQPTVSVLRALITKQTWPPAEINKGDTWWFSDTTGAHLSDASLWRPESGEAWLPLGPVPGPNPGKPPAKSTEGLMKPSSSPYPSNCGQYSSQSDAGRERRLRSHLRSAPGARHQGNERLSCKASTAVGSSSGKSNESCRVRIEMTDVIVVIGAGSIGQAIVRRVSAGKHVLLADIRQENADAAAKNSLRCRFQCQHGYGRCFLARLCSCSC
jgi:hypothetical protein